MTHTRLINIADIIVAIHSNRPETVATLERRYGDFLTESGDPHLTVECWIEDDAQFIEPQPGTSWEIELEQQDELLHYRSYYEKAVLDVGAGRATLRAATHAQLENFLRVVYAWLALQHGGVLLHAAGLVRDGRGYVFFGPSGAGKSTTARLSRGVAEILSDDIVLLRRRDDRFYLYGVPFIGELGAAPRRNQHAPLAAILRLQQDVAHRVASVPRALAVAELVSALPFIVLDSRWGEQALAICNDLTRRVPVQRLHFRRDPHFWEKINGYHA